MLHLPHFTAIASTAKGYPEAAFKLQRLHFSSESASSRTAVPASSPMPSDEAHQKNEFCIVKEELCYSRYLNVYNRIVEFPSTEDTPCRMVAYDIVGSRTVSFHYCTVFPFDCATKLVTLIKEYAQGANDFLYGVPTGGLSEKHDTLEDCARKELSEEVHLQGGRMAKLIPDGHPGILEVKWCRNRFTPFIVLDPVKDPTPLPKDPEEMIEVVKVDVQTLKSIMYSGNMMLPSIVTCNIALHYLQENNIL